MRGTLPTPPTWSFYNQTLLIYKSWVFSLCFLPPPPPSPALMSIRAEAPAETPRSRRAHRAGPQDVEPAAY